MHAPEGSDSVWGAFKDDETLQDICDEAYRLRDAERAALDLEGSPYKGEDCAMQLAVNIEQRDGNWSAAVIGAADLRTTAPSREMALAMLRGLIRQRVSEGTLAFLDVATPNIMDLFGKYKDDSTLDGICEEAYRERDAEACRSGFPA